MKKNQNFRVDADYIIQTALAAIQPEKAVKDALRGFDRDCHILAIGKAAWTMAKTAFDVLGPKVKGGAVITKYGHGKGQIGSLALFEAGHPLPDENSVKATEFAIGYFSRLAKEDCVVFLISGGGSALFESPADGVSLKEVEEITAALIRCGADITKINTVRKRLSKVKGGGFAEICAPARVYAVILSDVLGDDPAAIASGPACPDDSTAADALEILENYDITVSENILAQLKANTPKQAANAENRIIGSVRELCKATAAAAKDRGYTPYMMADNISCQAKEAGSILASMAHGLSGGQTLPLPLALIFGGETVVQVTGNGKGGRNQELALSAALGIRGLENACIFSLGSDGTDGPTDAAGGIVDGYSAGNYELAGYDPAQCLKNNDSYPVLKSVGDLIITGPTGTNVNDVAVVLIK